MDKICWRAPFFSCRWIASLWTTKKHRKTYSIYFFSDNLFIFAVSNSPGSSLSLLRFPPSESSIAVFPWPWKYVERSCLHHLRWNKSAWKSHRRVRIQLASNESLRDICRRFSGISARSSDYARDGFPTVLWWEIKNEFEMERALLYLLQQPT